MSNQCAAVTRNSERCSWISKTGKFCWQHGKNDEDQTYGSMRSASTPLRESLRHAASVDGTDLAPERGRNSDWTWPRAPKSPSIDKPAPMSILTSPSSRRSRSMSPLSVRFSDEIGYHDLSAPGSDTPPYSPERYTEDGEKASSPRSSSQRSVKRELRQSSSNANSAQDRNHAPVAGEPPFGGTDASANKSSISSPQCTPHIEHSILSNCVKRCDVQQQAVDKLCRVVDRHERELSAQDSILSSLDQHLNKCDADLTSANTKLGHTKDIEQLWEWIKWQSDATKLMQKKIAEQDRVLRELLPLIYGRQRIRESNYDAGPQDALADPQPYRKASLWPLGEGVDEEDFS